MSDAEPKPLLPLLLRLAFVLTVLSIVTVNLAIAWPPWEEDRSGEPLLSERMLDDGARMAWETEWAAREAKMERVGWLTYVKRNYKKWLRKYAAYKVKKKVEKILKQVDKDAEKQKQ